MLGSSVTTVTAAAKKTVQVKLNEAGRRLLSSDHVLHVKVTLSQSTTPGKTVVVSRRALTFKSLRTKRKR